MLLAKLYYIRRNVTYIHFSTEVSHRKMQQVMVQLPADVKAQLDALRKHGTTASRFIRHLLEQHFDPIPAAKKGRCRLARSTRGLYKRGDKWWKTYRDAIATQRFESCKTSNKKEAEQRLIDRWKEAREGIEPAAPIKLLALEDRQARYLSFVDHQRGVATKHYHFAHFKRVWGNPLIHSLTVEALDQYRAVRLGEKVGPATINREMATVKHALSKAVEWKLLRKTAREELTAIKKYQEPNGRLRYLSGQAEADRLLQACDASLRPIIVTALHTGMRKGELLSLTWDLVGMTHGFIRLKQTKNGKARALPFNETLWTLFSGLRTRRDVPWVFHDAAGHRWNDTRHPFEAACEAAGLTDFHFHDLRHTYASWLMIL